MVCMGGQAQLTFASCATVWSLDSNRWQPQATIPPDNVVDLVEASKVPNALALLSRPPPSLQSILSPQLPIQTQPKPLPASFTDPAILSYKPRPAGQTSPTPPQNGTQVLLPGQGLHRVNTQPVVAVPKVHVQDLSGEVTPTGTVVESFANLSIQTQAKVQGRSIPTGLGGQATATFIDAAAPDADADAAAAAASQDQGRRRQKNKRQPRQSKAGSAAEPSDGAGRGKGWRETPILQSTSSFQPFNSLKRKAGRGRTPANPENGWASEDVTDVQEAGDFDFESGIAKFDKRTLFDQLRKDDDVGDAERLVSHNRQPKPKPGTAGGKNLHYTENVLDLPSTSTQKGPKDSPVLGQDYWNSEADDGLMNGGERVNARDMGSRQSSRRGDSKISTSRRSQSRKASATNLGPGPTRVNSGVRTSNSGSTSRQTAKKSYTNAKGAKQLLSAAVPPYGFYSAATRRQIATVSPLQMLNLENIAHNELGLTEEMMAENAGRGIAEVTLTVLEDPAITLRLKAAEKKPEGPAGSANAPTQPTVVVLAGNNKSGARAVAGSRHLRNKGLNVVLCVVGIERGERDLLEEMRQQLRLYRNFGGRVYTKNDLFEHLRKATIPVLTIDTPRNAVVTVPPPAVTLIIDALLGLAISFEELRTGEQATVYQLMDWANRNEAFVLSVDVPSGVEPTTGKLSVIDGQSLSLRPRYVVVMGAPKRGLLEAIAAADHGECGNGAEAEASDDSALDWRLFIADIGFGGAVWKKMGTKIRRGIDFQGKWVLEMKYQSTLAEDDGAEDDV